MSQQDMDKLERCIADLKKLEAQYREKQQELNNVIVELSVGNRLYQTVLGTICNIKLHGDYLNVVFDISKDSKGVATMFLETVEGDDNVKTP